MICCCMPSSWRDKFDWPPEKILGAPPQARQRGGPHGRGEVGA